MATERNVVDFKIHNLTEEQFQELKEQGKIDPNAVYCTPDTTQEQLNNKANRDLGNTDLALLKNADGTLTWAGKNLLTKEYYGSEDADSVTINAGSSMYLGARLTLNGILGVGESGTSAPAGGFGLRASSNSTKLYELIGFPNGTLTWNGINMPAIGMPSQKTKTITLGASSTNYTAPADGYFVLYGQASADWQFTALARGSLREISVVNNGGNSSVVLPVRKSDSVNVVYTTTKNNSLTFIYATGTQHEAS